MKKYKHITIAGDLGSGKSTVCKILCKRLGINSYSTGTIQRDYAAKMGISTVQLNKEISKHPQIDKFIDDSLIALNGRDESLVVDSRMAWHFVKNSLKVFLTCDITVAAQRIFSDNRLTEKTQSVEQTKSDIITRKKCEEDRYLELYDVHISDKSNYDLIIDTTSSTPEQIAEQIISAYNA